MLLKSRRRAGAVRNIPLLFFLAAGFLLVTAVLPLLGFGLTREAGVVALLIGGMGAGFLVMALLDTRTLVVVDNVLVDRGPLRRTEYPIEGASLRYDRRGIPGRLVSWLVLDRPGVTAPVLRLGHGMDMVREMERARMVAGTLGLPLHLLPGEVEAARAQSSGVFATRQIPWFIGGSILVMGAMGLVISQVIPDAPRGRLRVVCPAETPVEVEGVSHRRADVVELLVKPGTQRVRVLLDGRLQSWDVMVEAGATQTVRCDDPPR